MSQTILAIDDEPHMLILLERIIGEKTPYRITTTNTSLEVPKIFEETEFDLVITDLKMPGLDGIDILRLIKEKGRKEEVIIITAFGSVESAIEALSLGVFDYITKPFRKEQILFTVDRAMRWQLMKRETSQMAAIFDREPYNEALVEFCREYLRRLASRSGGNEKEIAERSGLPLETVTQALSETGKLEE